MRSAEPSTAMSGSCENPRLGAPGSPPVRCLAIRNWVVHGARDEGRRQDGMTSVEREKLRRLREAVKPLRSERKILAKAVAWIVRETDSIPPRLRVRPGELRRLSACYDVPPIGGLHHRVAPSSTIARGRGLREKIASIHTRSHGGDGMPPMHAELTEMGTPIDCKPVVRLIGRRACKG